MRMRSLQRDGRVDCYKCFSSLAQCTSSRPSCRCSARCLHTVTRASPLHMPKVDRSSLYSVGKLICCCVQKVQLAHSRPHGWWQFGWWMCDVVCDWLHNAAHSLQTQRETVGTQPRLRCDFENLSVNKWLFPEFTFKTKIFELTFLENAKPLYLCPHVVRNRLK